MNLRKLHFYVSVFGVSAAGLAAACGSFSPYPQPDPIGLYPAGYQHPGSGAASGGGGLDGGVPCTTTEAGTVCPEGGGLPDVVTPPMCPGCVQVAPANNPQSIALDTTNIYWSDGTGDPWIMIPPGTPGSDTIMQAARGGSASSATVLVPGLSGPFIVKDQGSWLAWSNFSGALPGDNSIDTFMVGGAGGANTPGPALSSAHGVALDATNVYWVSRATGGAVVQSAPLAGGAVSTLGMTPAGVSCVPLGMAINATTLYFVGYEGMTGELFSMPITGGVPTAIWTAPGIPTKPVDVAVDGANVYWIDNGSGTGTDGKVYSMPLSGGTVTTMASGLTNPLTLAIDSKNIYFTASDGIHEEAKGSTSPTLIAAIGNSVGVAADDTDGFVYFTHVMAILAHAK